MSIHLKMLLQTNIYQLVSISKATPSPLVLISDRKNTVVVVVVQ